MKRIAFETHKRNEILDITAQVGTALKALPAGSGILMVYCPHTTAGISVNENYDPDVKSDMLTFLNKLVPQDSDFDHAEGNSDAHIKGGLLNFSQSFIVEDGQLQLGQWQGIFFMEFDGPRQREVWLQFCGETN
jgi:secondary thiamine-phosphate synthase enzyme